MTREWETLLCEVSDEVATVTLNRPERLNAMNLTMRRELRLCFEELRYNGDVAVVVVTGAGDAFSAGGDVNDFDGASSEQLHELMGEVSHRWFEALWQLPKPTIAAVNGVAAGGGANLALACDIVMAGESARFGETFSRIGLIPDLGGLFLLVRAVGLHRAKELCLTGDVIDSQEALKLGIFNHVLPDDELPEAVAALAQKLSTGPRTAQAITKRVLNRAVEMSMEEMLLMEHLGQSFLFGTEDHIASRTAFLNGEAHSFLPERPGRGE